MIAFVHAATVIALIVVAVDDLRNYKIRNAGVVALLCLTSLHLSMIRGFEASLWHVALAALFLPLLIFAHARDLMGGGDAKLIAVAFLWVGPQSSFVFAVALLLCTLVYWAAAKLKLVPHQRVGGRIRVPFGPSIAAAWILTIAASAAPFAV